MKKTFAVFALTTISLLSPTPVFAQFDNIRSGQNTIVSHNEIIDHNFFLATGDRVEVFGTINGDLIAAGGQIIIEGTVNGDIIAAGGQVHIGGLVSNNVRAAGGDVSITGTVGRNVTIIGGNLEISKSAQIGGGLLAAGGNLSHFGSVQGEIIAGSGNLLLSGFVNSDIKVAAGELHVTPEATITGSLTHNSNASVSVADQASILGGIATYQTPAEVGTELDQHRIQAAAKQAFHALSFGMQLASFFSALTVGFVFLRLTPRHLGKTASVISKRPIVSFIVGFTFVILTPIFIFLTSLTFLGLPLAMFIFLAYLIYLYLSKIYIAYWIGTILANRFNQTNNRYLSFLIGLTLLFLLKSVPIIGVIVCLMTLFFGVGAALIHDKHFIVEARKAKLF